MHRRKALFGAGTGVVLLKFHSKEKKSDMVGENKTTPGYLSRKIARVYVWSFNERYAHQPRMHQ